MTKSVLKSASYVLVHAPDMVKNGSTYFTEKVVNPDSEYLKVMENHLRMFDQVVSYPPNQVYIGNITPNDLKGFEFPLYDKNTVGADRFGKMG